MTDKKAQAQYIFGQHAQQYVQSQSHAGGYSLQRLVEVLNPQAGWRLLDIATGGGHTALACANQGAHVIASDLTFPMLQAARQFIQGQIKSGVSYTRHDGEKLPYAPATFEALTCRIAAHHFPDIGAFVREAARVLKPGGRFMLADIISPEDKKAAHYCNRFETLRDPSHVWALSLGEWAQVLGDYGLAITYQEPYGQPQHLGVWAERVGCTPTTIHRLRAMLLQAPPPIRAWYAVQAGLDWSPQADIPFVIQQALILAQKS